MSLPKARRQRGFTLIELILVITILGVISVSVAQVISLSAQIYITGAERTRLRTYPPCFRCALHYIAARKRTSKYCA